MLKKEKNSYAVFFPPQKLTSIFSVKHTCPVHFGARLTTQKQKFIFSPKGKIAPQKIYHENTVK